MSTICQTTYLGLTDYIKAHDLQKAIASHVGDGSQPHTLLLLEHPHVYTMGRRAKDADVLLSPQQIVQRGVQVQWTDRGGEATYHGPGQLVGYPILDLHKLGMGPIKYVRSLEEVLIRTLATFDIKSSRIEKLTGVWVGNFKIAAIGVHISRGVTTHGFALNVCPDLSYFDGIVPCGITNKGVTSMERVLSAPVKIEDVLPALIGKFGEVFGFESVQMSKALAAGFVKSTATPLAR